jgi:hypothetical protein
MADATPTLTTEDAGSTISSNIVNNDKATIAKLSTQLKRLTEANAKYKSLLKLAKDRIEKQEQESDDLKQDKATLEERLIYSDEKESSRQNTASDETSADDKFNENGESNTSLLRVCQRVKQRVYADGTNNNRSSVEHGELMVDEIWALMEVQVVPNEDGAMQLNSNYVTRQYREWMRFDTESQLEDYIRRDTGEPLTLPSYSLSPEQSALIQAEAENQVSKVTEEFRRFRVRSELARKQADAQVRELQSINAQHAAKQIVNGADSSKLDLEQARSASNQMERLKLEMAAQEAHWRESYDALLTENNALKSAGSEALLAAQWRQRYENCLKEKENLEVRLKAASLARTEGDEKDENEDKYEAKYRDLKGEFADSAFDKCDMLGSACILTTLFCAKSHFDCIARKPRRFLKRNS